MKAKRRRHSSEFKAKVGLEALNGLKTIQQIAKEYQVHPVQVSDWKKVIVESAVGAFEKGSSALCAQEFESGRTALNAIIGDLTVQLDFLKKNPNSLASERKAGGFGRKGPPSAEPTNPVPAFERVSFEL